jgi:hypothetical protein
MASPSLTAADATGNTFDNSTGQVYFWVTNGSGSSVTVTVAEQRTCSFGHSAQNFTAAVANGATTALGPFDMMRFNDASRLITATYSDTTSVTVAAVKG